MNARVGPDESDALTNVGHLLISAQDTKPVTQRSRHGENVRRREDNPPSSGRHPPAITTTGAGDFGPAAVASSSSVIVLRHGPSMDSPPLSPEFATAIELEFASQLRQTLEFACDQAAALIPSASQAPRFCSSRVRWRKQRIIERLVVATAVKIWQYRRKLAFSGGNEDISQTMGDCTCVCGGLRN